MNIRIWVVLACLLASSNVPAHGQSGQEPTTTEQQRSVPKDAASARKLAQAIEARVEELKKDDANKEIGEVLGKQRLELENLAGVHEEIAGHEAQAAKLQEQIKTLRAELAAAEQLKPKSRFQALELQDGSAKAEVELKIQQLESKRTRADSEVQAARKRLAELNDWLKVGLSDRQKEPLAEVAAARAAVQDARNNEPAKLSLRIEEAFLAEVKLENVALRHQRNTQMQASKTLEDRLLVEELKQDTLKRRLEVADAERILINDRLKEILDQKVKRQNLTIADRQAELNNLPKEREYERGWLELELLRFVVQNKTASFQKSERDFNKTLNDRGTLITIETQIKSLEDRIAGLDKHPENLPDDGAGLRLLRREEQERYKVIRRIVVDKSVRIPQVAGVVADAAWNRDDLGARFRQAKEAWAPGSRPDARSENEWETLRNEVEEALNTYKREVDQALTGLTSNKQKWEKLETRSDANIRALSKILLWTRDESNISMVSIKQAGEDLSEVAGNLGALIKDVATRTISVFTAFENRLRSIIALVFIVVAGIFFWRLRRSLPKTYGWLDAQADEGKTAPLVVGIILRRTELTLMLAIIFVGAPFIAGFDTRTIQIAACIFGVPFLYRLGRVLLDVFMMPGKDEERIFNLDENLAETLHRAGRWLLNLALVFVPAGLLLDLVGYRDQNPGFVELWWLVYESLSHAILLFSVFRPAVVGSIIRGGGIVAMSVKTWILILYPFVVCGVIFLYVLGSLRYLEAEAFFQELLLKSLGVLLVGYVGYRLVLRGVIKGRNLAKDPNPDEFDDDGAYVDAGRNVFFDRLTRSFLRLLFLLPVGFLLYRFWDEFDMPFMRTGLFGADTVTMADILKAVIAIILTTSIVRIVRQALAFVVLPRTDLDKGLRYTVSMLATYGLWTIGLVISLNILKIRGQHIAVFTGALAFGIGFGLQSIVKNFVSGLILLIERPVKVGDKIDVDGRGGSVEKITLRATTVMTWEGTGIVIPNETMVGGTLTNHSLGHPRLRSTLTIGVAYGTDIRRVREILTETVSKHGLVLKRPQPAVYFVGFGASSLDFEVRYWTALNTNRPLVISDLRFAIEEAFRKEDIEIPFDQRDLNIRSVDDDVVAAFGGRPIEIDDEEATNEQEGE